MLKPRIKSTLLSSVHLYNITEQCNVQYNDRTLLISTVQTFPRLHLDNFRFLQSGDDTAANLMWLLHFLNTPKKERDLSLDPYVMKVYVNA